jgi:hypothetical protein
MDFLGVIQGVIVYKSTPNPTSMKPPRKEWLVLMGGISTVSKWIFDLEF